MASGEMSKAEFTAFLQSAFSYLATYSVDGAIHFQCMDWRHCPEIRAAGAAAYTELKNICIWAKNNGGMGSLYRSQHEFVFVFKSGTAPHINNVELGKHGRNRTNVWSYAGVNSFGEDRGSSRSTYSEMPACALGATCGCERRGMKRRRCTGRWRVLIL